MIYIKRLEVIGSLDKVDEINRDIELEFGNWSLPYVSEIELNDDNWKVLITVVDKTFQTYYIKLIIPWDIVEGIIKEGKKFRIVLHRFFSLKVGSLSYLRGIDIKLSRLFIKVI